MIVRNIFVQKLEIFKEQLIRELIKNNKNRH